MMVGLFQAIGWPFVVEVFGELIWEEQSKTNNGYLECPYLYLVIYVARLLLLHLFYSTIGVGIFFS
jgi:hypothetical protein